jgi:DNA polymerase I-like protein with 3'-5' exonuclease and polymerase domains
MGPKSLALRLGCREDKAVRLLALHQWLYPNFWVWKENALENAILRGFVQTVFGWRQKVSKGFNARSLYNFHCQANAAEMMRLAACLAVEDGLGVCWLIHDAILVESPIGLIEEHTARLQAHMAEASSIILNGPVLQSEAKTVVYPEHYSDPRGERMWNVVMSVL